MPRSLQRLSRGSYRVARASRDLNAITKAGATGSMWPIIRRLLNKAIGRVVVSRL